MSPTGWAVSTGTRSLPVPQAASRDEDAQAGDGEFGEHGVECGQRASVEQGYLRPRAGARSRNNVRHPVARHVRHRNTHLTLEAQQIRHEAAHLRAVTPVEYSHF